MIPITAMQRAAFRSRAREETSAEFAKRIGVKPGAVRLRIYRARKKLRDATRLAA